MSVRRNSSNWIFWQCICWELPNGNINSAAAKWFPTKKGEMLIYHRFDQLAQHQQWLIMNKPKWKTIRNVENGELVLHIEQMTIETIEAKIRKRKRDHLRFNARIWTHTHVWASPRTRTHILNFWDFIRCLGIYVRVIAMINNNISSILMPTSIFIMRNVKTKHKYECHHLAFAVSECSFVSICLR